MPSPRALVLLHHPAHGPGVTGRELGSAGLVAEYVDGPEGEMPPRDLTGVAAVVSLAGPQSANDEDEFPWMRRELALLREALESRVPVIGIGLGARLLARAAGGHAVPLVREVRGADGSAQSAHWLEAGWAAVGLSDSAVSEAEGFFRGLPPRFEAFHFHHETVAPPQSADGAFRVLAYSDATPVQAFEVQARGIRHLGLEFDLGITPEGVAAIVDSSRELVHSAGLSEAHLMMDCLRRCHALELVASQVIGRFFGHVAADDAG